MTTAAELRNELQALGVALAAAGDRLRFSPRSAVTGELLTRLRDAKPELLAMLRPQDPGPVMAGPSVMSGGDRHGADGPQDAGPSDIDAAEWLDLTDPDGRRCLVRSDAAGLEIIDAKPCPVCGGLERWQDLAGGWHGERCEPRTRATWLRQRAAELRERHARNPRG